MISFIFLIVLLALSFTLYSGMHTIKFVCWFSAKCWDIHDYFQDCGGDGHPSHMHTYTCWNCGKRFDI